MKNVIAPLLLAVASTAFANQDVEQNTSVHVVNLSAAEVDVWINGEPFSIAPSSGISTPCLDGEETELQSGDQLTFIPCGEAVELPL